MKQSKHTERNLVQEIAKDAEILDKVNDKVYAHKLYAALCNTVWQPADILDILRENTWSASWRSAGGIVADLRNEGDYLNWYCSGHEGYVHPEVRADLERLGWHCIEEDDVEEFGGVPSEESWAGPKGIAGALGDLNISFARFRKPGETE